MTDNWSDMAGMVTGSMRDIGQVARSSRYLLLKEVVPVTHERRLDATDEDGATILHWACRGNSLEVVKLLLQQGVNVGLRNSNWETPLEDLKREKKFEDVARLLIDYGADTDGIDLSWMD